MKLAYAIAAATFLGGCITIEKQLPPFTGRYCSAANEAKYRPMAEDAARAEGISPAFFTRLVEHESCWNPNARGAHGEYGLGQIKCATARGIGYGGACSALLDPKTNLRWSAKYLAIGLQKCNGHRAGAAYLYNAGQYSSCGGRNAYTKLVADNRS